MAATVLTKVLIQEIAWARATDCISKPARWASHATRSGTYRYTHVQHPLIVSMPYNARTHCRLSLSCKLGTTCASTGVQPAGSVFAHGGVGDQQAIVLSHSFRPAHRALVQDDLAPAWGWGAGGHHGGIWGGPGRLQPVRSWVGGPIHDLHEFWVLKTIIYRSWNVLSEQAIVRSTQSQLQLPAADLMFAFRRAPGDICYSASVPYKPCLTNADHLTAIYRANLCIHLCPAAHSALQRLFTLVAGIKLTSSARYDSSLAALEESRVEK